MAIPPCFVYLTKEALPAQDKFPVFPSIFVFFSGYDAFGAAY